MNLTDANGKSHTLAYLQETKTEYFFPIPEFSDYQVSNFGNIKSFKKGKERILKAKTQTGGYAQVTLYKKGWGHQLTVHQIMGIVFFGVKSAHGHKNKIIDHKNGIRNDNHLSNLQPLSHRENITKAFKGKSSSKYTGVSPHPHGGYVARIRHNNKVKHIGYFMDEKEASEAYQNELNKLIPAA